MYRTHSCGALTASDINKEVTLAGWVQKSRDKGFMIWIDLRDRYGLTQLIFDEERTAADLMEKAFSIKSAAVLSSSKINCVRPYRSRRSIQIINPLSLDFCTQPAKVTSLLMSEAVKAPQECVLYIFYIVECYFITT